MTKSVDDKFDDRTFGKKVASGAWTGAKFIAKWGVGKPFEYLVIKPAVAGVKDLISRYFNVYDGQYAIVSGDYKLARDETSLEQIKGSIRIGLNPVEIYNDNPLLFSKKTKILPPKRKPWYRPFGAYFKGYGKDAIIIDTKKRNLDPKARKVQGLFQGFPITFDVDLRLSYRDDPIPYFLAHSGKILQIADKRGKVSKEAIGNMYVSLREDINNQVISFAVGSTTDHFVGKEITEASKLPINPLRNSRLREEQLRYGIGVSDVTFDVESYKIPPEQQKIMYDLLLTKQMNANGSENELKDFVKVVDSLSNLSSKTNFENDFKYLLQTFIQFKRTGSFIPGTYRASAYDANKRNSTLIEPREGQEPKEIVD